MANYYTFHLFMLLFHILIYLPMFHSRSQSGDNINIDMLLPYPDAEAHLDSKRTHRYVRECLPLIHGNQTHVSIKPNDTYVSFDVHPFVYDFKGTRGKQYGHHAIVKNPLKMISVLEPVGSCREHSLATVRDTAYSKHCELAINAGFFNNSDSGENRGECFGNIISQSHLVNDARGIQNANFGIRKDGTVVIGYLSEDEVNSLDQPDNPFMQLISGVGWIIRNGESYLEESLKAECRELENTGTLSEFFKVQAARTIVGVDAKGYVHLITIDGKTWERGWVYTVRIFTS